MPCNSRPHPTIWSTAAAKGAAVSVAAAVRHRKPQAQTRDSCRRANERVPRTVGIALDQCERLQHRSCKCAATCGSPPTGMRSRRSSVNSVSSRRIQGPRITARPAIVTNDRESDLARRAQRVVRRQERPDPGEHQHCADRQAHDACGHPDHGLQRPARALREPAARPRPSEPTSLRHRIPRA